MFVRTLWNLFQGLYSHHSEKIPLCLGCLGLMKVRDLEWMMLELCGGAPVKKGMAKDSTYEYDVPYRNMASG